MNDFVPLREVARFIWFLKQRSNEKTNIIRTMHIIDICNERAGISSYSPRPDEALIFLEKIGIVNKEGVHLKLSSKCIELIRVAENPINFNDAQKEIMYGILLSHREIGEIIKYLFTICNLTEDGFPAISLDTIRRVDEQIKLVMQLLQELNVFYWDGSRFRLNKDKLKFVDNSTLGNIALDECTLEEILKYQKKVSRAAEDFIVEWEKHRLEFQGDKQLIKLVRRVSSENVNLGYDITSIDGGKNDDVDRLIEVKSSCGSNFSFYWSSNEIECARRFRKNYWLYFVPRANILPLKKPCVYIIRDPVSYLNNYFKCTEKTLHVWYDFTTRKIKNILDFGNDWCGLFL